MGRKPDCSWGTSKLNRKKGNTMTYKCYSDYFTTVYDEDQPIGNMGRGGHYSVLRYATWHDVEAKQINTPQTHDFAVVWDEDHDTRIIFVIEKLLEAGLLAPIQFIGERKAFLSVVVAAKFYFSLPEEDLVKYQNKIQEIVSDVNGDYWNLEELGCYDKSIQSPHQTFLPSMISTNSEKQETYLRNIDNLWGLGTKPFIKKPTPASHDVMPPFLSSMSK